MNAKNSIQLEAENQVAGLRAELRALILLGEELRTKQKEAFALKLFRFQAEFNAVYGQYVELRGVDPKLVNAVNDIPFLPVEVFQSQAVHVFPKGWKSSVQFRSSGTTGSVQSVHHVDEVIWYNEMALQGFEYFFNSAHECKFCGLLPGYLERGDSSLVHMVRNFMFAAGESDPDALFFMHNWSALEEQLNQWVDEDFSGDIYLIGVTHALLRWVDSLNKESIDNWSKLKLHVFETGGMKGKGPELIRSEVHQRLGRLVGSKNVCSEYGMTELLSQAWSKGGGVFNAPPWMEVKTGAFDDPIEWKEAGKQGRLHVVDLANIASCAFLSTGDIGRCYEDGSFEVLGRYDHAEVRGCNLMAFNF